MFVTLPSLVSIDSLQTGSHFTSSENQSESSTPGSWLNIETQRVRILFQLGDLYAAEEIATYADQIVNQLSEILEYSPPELIPIVLRGQTDQANGYFTVGPKRVVIMVSPDSRYPGYFGPAESWLRLVVTHELVHYIQLTRPIGIPGILSRLLGELPAGGSAAGTLPGWFIEGTAVYLESLLTSGGRGRSGAFTMEILANLYDLDSWTYRQAEYDALASFDSRIYRSGYILVSYIAQEFGFSLLNRLQEATWSGARIDGARGFDQHLARLTGISNDELWARAQRAFLNRYWERLSDEPGKPWQVLPRNPGIFSRVSLPEPVDGGWILSYQDVWTPGSLGFLPNTPGAKLTILTPVWLQNSQGFAAQDSWVVFSQREFRTQERDSSATTTRLYLGRLDVSKPDSPQLVDVLPLESLESDVHSPGISVQRNSRSQQDILQILALKRTGATHQLIGITSTAHEQQPEIFHLGIPFRGKEVLGSQFNHQVLYSNESRLGSPRFNPSGNLIALPELQSSHSRIVFLSPFTGEHLLEPTPWIYGSIEHPRWFSETQLVVTVDSQGFRSPYLLDVEHPNLWVPLPSDPVGTASAMVISPDLLLYQTVRSRSHELLTHNLPRTRDFLSRAEPIGRLGPDTLTTPGISHDVQNYQPDHQPTTEGSLSREFQPAKNLLRFHTWFPQLLIRPSAYGTDNFFLDIDLALGAMFLWNDPVEEQSLAIQGSLFVRSLQPDVLLTYRRVVGPTILGPVELGLSLEQTYRSFFSLAGVPEGFQTTSLTARSQSNLAQWSGLGHTTRLLGALTLQGSITLQSRREFSIADSFQSVQVLEKNFEGTSDPQAMLARPSLIVSGGLGLFRWSVHPRWAFYGGNQVSLSSSILVAPDLTGYSQGAPTLAGVASFSLGRLVDKGTLFRLQLNTALSNGLNGQGLLDLPGGFLPTFQNPVDGALTASTTMSIPLAITDIKTGRLVLDRVGLSLGAQWQGGMIIPGVRNPALEDQLLSRRAWNTATGSAIGAPGTSAQAFEQVNSVSLPSVYNSLNFFPSRFIALTATLDLGIGVWAPQRPLLQLGASIKVPLSATESWGILPLMHFDLSNVLP